MKKVIPNKALPYKILCGAVKLMVYLVAPQAYHRLNVGRCARLKRGLKTGNGDGWAWHWPSIKRELERGLALGIGRTETTARAAARKIIPKDGRLYGAPVYIKNANNIYTCYLKWKWTTRASSIPAK